MLDVLIFFSSSVFPFYPALLNFFLFIFQSVFEIHGFSKEIVLTKYVAYKLGLLFTFIGSVMTADMKTLDFNIYCTGPTLQ